MADPKGKAKKTPVEGASAGRKSAASKVSAASSGQSTPKGGAKPKAAAAASKKAPPAKPVTAAPARLAAATAELDPVAAMVGETISKERGLELRRAARRRSAPPSRRGMLYDTR